VCKMSFPMCDALARSLALLSAEPQRPTLCRPGWTRRWPLPLRWLRKHERQQLRSRLLRPLMDKDMPTRLHRGTERHRQDGVLPGRRNPKVAFIEWTRPIFPGGHWTPQMIELAGGISSLNPPTSPGSGAPPS
ncbi:hypothetical protein Agub_g3156, partial [Astrephomene gubernaculifera]